MDLMDFDMEKLRKEQEAADQEKQTIGVLGNVADSMANVPTAWEIMKGREGKRIDLAGQAKAMQDSVADPWERRKKLYEQYKMAKEGKQDAEESDVASEKSRRAREMISGRFPRLGKSVEGLSYADIRKNPFLEKMVSGEYGLAEKSLDMQKELLKTKQQKDQLKQLPPDKILGLSEANQVPNLLSDLENTLDSNEDSFGPVAGRIAGLNPYNEGAKTIDAQVRNVRQTIGKLKEGGVLRPEDERKYAMMLPSLTDTPAIAKNKLQLVAREMATKQMEAIQALRRAGYDVSAFDSAAMTRIPDVPSAISGGGGKSYDMVPNAVADSGPHGPVVVQNGTTFMWNSKKQKYEAQ